MSYAGALTVVVRRPGMNILRFSADQYVVNHVVQQICRLNTLKGRAIRIRIADQSSWCCR
jgi:hypothetical protein